MMQSAPCAGASSHEWCLNHLLLENVRMRMLLNRTSVSLIELTNQVQQRVAVAELQAMLERSLLEATSDNFESPFMEASSSTSSKLTPFTEWCSAIATVDSVISTNQTQDIFKRCELELKQLLQSQHSAFANKNGYQFQQMTPISTLASQQCDQSSSMATYQQKLKQMLSCSVSMMHWLKYEHVRLQTTLERTQRCLSDMGGILALVLKSQSQSPSDRMLSASCHGSTSSKTSCDHSLADGSIKNDHKDNLYSEMNANTELVDECSKGVGNDAAFVKLSMNIPKRCNWEEQRQSSSSSLLLSPNSDSSDELLCESLDSASSLCASQNTRSSALAEQYTNILVSGADAANMLSSSCCAVDSIPQSHPVKAALTSFVLELLMIEWDLFNASETANVGY
jgi:hypothetical protein